MQPSLSCDIDNLRIFNFYFSRLPHSSFAVGLEDDIGLESFDSILQRIDA